MHHQLEILMPPTSNVEQSVEQVLEQFSENADEEDRSNNAFWDFWVIGGRFSGSKFQDSLDQDKLKEFREKLSEMKVTVSGVTCGKQTLQPSSQIESVDSLWRDYFPNSVEACPMFSHSNDQYSSESTTYMDICELKNIAKNTKCGHFILATLNYAETAFKAEYMIEKSMWNGVNFVESGWDGEVSTAIDMAAEKTKHYKDEYKEKRTPKGDWVLVTVDYHS